MTPSFFIVAQQPCAGSNTCQQIYQLKLFNPYSIDPSPPRGDIKTHSRPSNPSILTYLNYPLIYIQPASLITWQLYYTFLSI